MSDNLDVEVVRFSQESKVAWNEFVANSKNGTFLFFRDYIEYHADRFADHSLLFYRKGKLIALMPANEVGEELQTHGGLTYGGIVSSRGMKAALMLQVVEALQLYMKDTKFTRLLYKAVPHIYHQSPAEEDLYALSRFGAALIRRDLNSVISLKSASSYSKLRKRKLAKVNKLNLEIGQSDKIEEFMDLMGENLKTRYNLKPVHSADEMLLLAQKFPDQIKLYTASEEGKLVSGVIVYETSKVAHCQYIATTQRGKSINGMDALFDYLLREVYASKAYFSFGVSTEQQGQFLNEGLVRYKESYGASSLVQDFYELKL